MILSDFSASLSCNISPKTVGTICHDKPYLSLSQPHCPFSPPLELERNGHYRSLWPSGDLCPFFPIAGNASNLRIFKNRHVKNRSLFGLIVEPQMRVDFLHIASFS